MKVKRSCRAKAARTRAQKQSRAGGIGGLAPHGRAVGDRACLVPGRHRTGHPPGQRAYPGTKNSPRRRPGHARAQKQPPAGAGGCAQAALWGNGGQWGVWCREGAALGAAGARGTPGRKTAPGGGRRLSGCGIWVLLAPGDPCDLDAQGGQHSQAEDHAQLSQGEICHQEQAMQSGDQQHSQEQQHAHAEGSQ